MHVTSIGASSNAVDSDPTTRFVQGCVKRHVQQKYGGVVRKISPIGNSTYNDKHAWYVKAIFASAQGMFYGEFYVQIKGNRPSDLYVAHDEVRPH